LYNFNDISSWKFSFKFTTLQYCKEVRCVKGFKHNLTTELSKLIKLSLRAMDKSIASLRSAAYFLFLPHLSELRFVKTKKASFL
jgi:hypothetical protein